MNELFELQQLILANDIYLKMMAGLYLFTGVLHFTAPGFFINIIPRPLPYPHAINWISGGVEIILAIGLLIKFTRPVSALLLALFLILVFPANIVQFYQWSKRFNIPVSLFWVFRTSLQVFIMWLALIYV